LSGPQLQSVLDPHRYDLHLTIGPAPENAAPRFSIYSTRGIKQRFGSNTTMAVTFNADDINSVVVPVTIGGPLLAAILGAYET